MATKKKKCNCKHKKGSYPPIYVQSSNPSPALLKWIADQNEDGKIVYLQSGTPPTGCVPGSPNCPPKP